MRNFSFEAQEYRKRNRIGVVYVYHLIPMRILNRSTGEHGGFVLHVEYGIECRARTSAQRGGVLDSPDDLAKLIEEQIKLIEKRGYIRHVLPSLADELAQVDEAQ